MDPNRELREFLERALVENIDSLEIVEKLVATEESGDNDPNTAPPETMVRRPAKPRPHQNSGGIALPDPD